MLEMCLC